MFRLPIAWTLRLLGFLFVIFAIAIFANADAAVAPIAVHNISSSSSPLISHVSINANISLDAVSHLQQPHGDTASNVTATSNQSSHIRTDNMSADNESDIGLIREIVQLKKQLAEQQKMNDELNQQVGDLRRVEQEKEDEVDYETGKIRLANGSWIEKKHGVPDHKVGDENEADDPALLHEDTVFLSDILVVVLSSTVLGSFAVSLHMPTFVGFVVGGIIVGPSGIGLVRHFKYMESLAQAGVSLLLFESGIQFNREAAAQAYRLTMWTFLAQVCMLGTLLPGIGSTLGWSVSVGEMFLLCLLLALSSSTVSSELAEENHALDAPSVRVAISLIAGQDLCMGLLLCLPEAMFHGILGIFLIMKQIIYGAILAFSGMYCSTRFMPSFVKAFLGRPSSKVFLLALLSLCSASAGLSSLMGLSLEFGAMFAGIAMCRSDVGHAAGARLRPLVEVFSGVLFTSIGMLISPRFLLSNLLTVLLSFFIVFWIKFISAFFVAKMFGHSALTSATIGLCVSSLAEFSMIVAGKAYQLGVLSRSIYLHLLSMTVFSFIVTPLIFNVAMSHLSQSIMYRHAATASVDSKTSDDDDDMRFLHDL